MSSSVSFTIRRPTPVSRAASSGPDSDTTPPFKVPNLPPHLTDQPPRLGSPLARGQSSPNPASDHHEVDSSDEASSNEDELVTGFDKFGVQRLNGKKKVEKPLVIPALKNKDWRDLARKRRGAPHYVPPSAAAETGKDGSVGGLGTRDTINSGPVLSGLHVKQKTTTSVNDDMVEKVETKEIEMDVVHEETEDERALRAILAESAGEIQQDGHMIDIIPTPISETDALRQDVEELPDASTLEDYARVPVSQFGAALLRGMGWKEGTAATRKPGKGLVEPYIPAPRPALLGIGAKEQEVYDDGSKKNGKFAKRPERRYVPVIKQELGGTPSPTGAGDLRQRGERSRSPRRSGPSSRRPSPDRYTRDQTKKQWYDDNERSGRNDEGRDGDRKDNGRERDADRRRDRERQRTGDRRRDDDQHRTQRKRERSYDSNRRKKDY